MRPLPYWKQVGSGRWVFPTSEYALEWCLYPHWTSEETANVLTGCVPHRAMCLKGKDHKALDEEVLATGMTIVPRLTALLRGVLSSLQP